MSEQTGATEHEESIEDVCHAAFRAALQRCPTIEYRIVPADAVVVTPEIAATAEEACEYASAVLRERADNVDWLPDTNVQGMRDRSAHYRAAAAALRGEG